jgi:hypothetical protein
VANCVVCRDDLDPGVTKCPRCGSDNSPREDMGLAYLRNFWGLLSFLLILPPLLMIMPGIFPLVNNALQPVASARVAGPIALLSTAIIAFYVFSLRETLYHYSNLRQFKEKPGPPLALLALQFFCLAILLAFFLAFAVTTKDSIVGPPGFDSSFQTGVIAFGSVWHLLFKLLMTGFLVFIFVFFSLSASMMAAYEYGTYLDEHRPDPIYLNEQLLLEVVLAVVYENLDSNIQLKVADMKRLEDGGISLKLHYRGEPAERGGVILVEEKTWAVEADRWGRVRKILEQSELLIPITQQV